MKYDLGNASPWLFLCCMCELCPNNVLTPDNMKSCHNALMSRITHYKGVLTLEIHIFNNSNVQYMFNGQSHPPMPCCFLLSLSNLRCYFTHH